MPNGLKGWLTFLAIIMLSVGTCQSSVADEMEENGVKKAVYLSPRFELEPGSVCNKFYYDIGFPKGHIAVKSFDAEVIDEAGNSVPLHETYLHHWLVVNYYQRQGGTDKPDTKAGGNDGLCSNALPQFFGLGSETRKTNTYVPDPYGMEFGNPAKIPSGYEERWILNVHAIDTRGAHDELGCTECRCDLYNVTMDETGSVLDPNYAGGLRCCYDNTRCRVKEGFQGAKRGLFMKYIVTYVDWHSSIVPVRVYIFDVTDEWRKSVDDDDSTGSNSSRHDCRIEYNVESCAHADENSSCIDTKSVSIILPTGGVMVYGVAHQHTGGIGSALYGQDGRVLCSSSPIYGQGTEPGNEAGYIVGMSTCYPPPGSVKISDRETLTVVSNYNSAQGHTGVMGLFYILVADFNSSSTVNISSQVQLVRLQAKMLTPPRISGMALLVIATVGIAAAAHQRRKQRENISGYDNIVDSFIVGN